jgi:hypothetical protein
VNEKGFYYLHTNGDLIFKPASVVEHDSEYFSSPFVKKVWMIETKERKDAWKLILESLANGARLDRVKELATKWNMTFEDSIEMLSRIKVTQDLREGLRIFIKSVLNMTEDEYWTKGEEVFERSKKNEKI